MRKKNQVSRIAGVLLCLLSGCSKPKPPEIRLGQQCRPEQLYCDHGDGVCIEWAPTNVTRCEVRLDGLKHCPPGYYVELGFPEHFCQPDPEQIKLK